MALRWMESFDDYNTATLGAQKWTTFNAGLTIVTSGARNVNSVKATNVNQAFTKTLDSQASWVVGFAFKIDAAFGTQRTIIRLVDNVTIQCSIALNPDSTLQVVRGNATAINASGLSSMSLNTGTWYYIEWKATIADSIGSNTCIVRVNGENWITVDSGQDLKVSANASANLIHFLDNQNTSITGAYYDDIYVLDGTGSAPHNDFLGDCRVEVIRPSGNGNYSQWLGSDADSTDNYQHVDDTNSDGDSTYVEESVVDDKDSYAFGDLTSTPDTIFGIQFNVRARKTDAGSISIAPLARVASTDYFGTGWALSDSFVDQTEIMEDNPNTAAAWTASGINNAEFGFKVLA